MGLGSSRLDLQFVSSRPVVTPAEGEVHLLEPDMEVSRSVKITTKTAIVIYRDINGEISEQFTSDFSKSHGVLLGDPGESPGSTSGKLYDIEFIRLCKIKVNHYLLMVNNSIIRGQNVEGILTLGSAILLPELAGLRDVRVFNGRFAVIEGFEAFDVDCAHPAKSIGRSVVLGYDLETSSPMFRTPHVQFHEILTVNSEAIVNYDQSHPTHLIIESRKISNAIEQTELARFRIDHQPTTRLTVQMIGANYLVVHSIADSSHPWTGSDLAVYDSITGLATKGPMGVYHEGIRVNGCELAVIQEQQIAKVTLPTNVGNVID